ncbi:hypothetical protein [Paraliobacillus ryukyuensis]|uniref:hypothetical protein n=1 Tax=Paraliobacillus ryukyuensis TaxID=200904 RepID=UPI0015C4A056|nr:hypothetical protein [Paraliobacillus ryukyuensis]
MCDKRVYGINLGRKEDRFVLGVLHQQVVTNSLRYGVDQAEVTWIREEVYHSADT